LNPVWISLWPAIQQDSEGFEDVTLVGKEFVSLGESVGLEVDQNELPQ
jgi:hypothetical protein